MGIVLLCGGFKAPRGALRRCWTATMDTPERTHEMQDERLRFDGKYLSVTSFRRDGTGVATPVWFVEEKDGTLLVDTGRDSYKTKRIRRDPHVRVALCSARGKLRTPPLEARAEVLSEDELARVKAMIARKYRADMLVIRPLRVIRSALHVGPSNDAEVVLAITPEG